MVLATDEVYMGSAVAASIQLLIHSLVKQCCVAANLTASSLPCPDLIRSGFDLAKSSLCINAVKFMHLCKFMQYFGEALPLGRSRCDPVFWYR